MSLGVYRAPLASQEAYQFVTIIAKIEGENNLPLGDQSGQ
jgi:hypothetical protein